MLSRSRVLSLGHGVDVKNTVFGCILFLLLYAFFECTSAAALFCLARFKNIHYMPVDRLSSDQVATIESFIDKSANYFEFDNATGWTIQSNGRYKELYQANSAGIRADREYGYDIPEGVVRICTFGDSFTHCDDVGNDSTWQVFMESSMPNLEVLNFGVGAYGLDQAYVRYRNKGRRYKTDFVFIGFMPENIFRMVNTFRAFYQADTGLPLSKPRFVLHEDGIVLLPNPLPSLADYRALLEDPKAQTSKMGVHDYFYLQRYTSGILDLSPGMRLFKMIMERVAMYFSGNEPIKKGVYNESSEAFEVTLKVFDLFYRSCQEHATPVILVFPYMGNMQQALRNGPKEYAPLLEYFDTKGYRYIDLMDAFEPELRQGNLDELFAGLHYSARANRIVAAHVLNYIEGCMQQQGVGAN